MFLFKNAKIFDGVNDQLIENGFVLIEGDEIKEISGNLIKTDKAETIDCKGHFLMCSLAQAIQKNIVFALPKILCKPF